MGGVGVEDLKGQMQGIWMVCGCSCQVVMSRFG